MYGVRILAALTIVLSIGCEEGGKSATHTLSGLRVDTVLGGKVAGFDFADSPHEFIFPDDHGAHPKFRSEWWYLTAVLQDSEGNDYGLHYTLFRQALTPAPPGQGPWQTGQAYLAHLAVTDARHGVHLEAERFSRGHPELAGVLVQADFLARIEDWIMQGEVHQGLSLTLTAAEADRFAVQVDIRQHEPIVLQGDKGWSRKGPDSASYYYSIPRLAINGSLTFEGRSVEVSGIAWLDREWSSSLLGENLAGWDWFALQLEDDRSVMAFQLRRKDGTRHLYDHGLLISQALLPDVKVVDSATKGVRLLRSRDFELKPLRYFKDVDGVRWPIAWQLRLGNEQLTIAALVDDQQIDLSIVYWEGLVEVLDQSDRRVGMGYMELTGYADSR